MTDLIQVYGNTSTGGVADKVVSVSPLDSSLRAIDSSPTTVGVDPGAATFVPSTSIDSKVDASPDSTWRQVTMFIDALLSGPTVGVHKIKALGLTLVDSAGNELDSWRVLFDVESYAYHPQWGISEVAMGVRSPDDPGDTDPSFAAETTKFFEYPAGLWAVFQWVQARYRRYPGLMLASHDPVGTIGRFDGELAAYLGLPPLRYMLPEDVFLGVDYTEQAVMLDFHYRVRELPYTAMTVLDTSSWTYCFLVSRHLEAYSVDDLLARAGMTLSGYDGLDPLQSARRTASRYIGLLLVQSTLNSITTVTTVQDFTPNEMGHS
jgi:hypothetical protein